MKILDGMHYHPTEHSGILEMTFEFVEQGEVPVHGKIEKTIIRCRLGKDDPADCVARQLRNVADEIDPPKEG